MKLPDKKGGKAPKQKRQMRTAIKLHINRKTMENKCKTEEHKRGRRWEIRKLEIWTYKSEKQLNHMSKTCTK